MDKMQTVKTILPNGMVLCAVGSVDPKYPGISIHVEDADGEILQSVVNVKLDHYFTPDGYKRWNNDKLDVNIWEDECSEHVTRKHKIPIQKPA